MDIANWLASPVGAAVHVKTMQQLDAEHTLIEAGTHVRDSSGHLVSTKEQYCDECGDKIQTGKQG